MLIVQAAGDSVLEALRAPAPARPDTSMPPQAHCASDTSKHGAHGFLLVRLVHHARPGHQVEVSAERLLGEGVLGLVHDPVARLVLDPEGQHGEGGRPGQGPHGYAHHAGHDQGVEGLAALAHREAEARRRRRRLLDPPRQEAAPFALRARPAGLEHRLGGAAQPEREPLLLVGGVELSRPGRGWRRRRLLPRPGRGRRQRPFRQP